MKSLSFIYYLGIIACGIQGSKKSCQQYKELCLPASFLAAMGGGMIRDLLILFVFPAAFTVSCILDDAVAICAGLIYLFYLKKHENHNIFKHFVLLTDALGVGSFVAFGINKAFTLGATQGIALCCGLATALGGGILSALLCGQSPRKVLISGFSYRMVTVLGAVLYIYCLTIGVNPVAAQYWIILYTLCFIPLTNQDFRETLARNIINIFEYSKATAIPAPMSVMIYQSNVCVIHITKQISFHSFYMPKNARNRNLRHMDYMINLSNFKLRCPRRFARGR